MNVRLRSFWLVRFAQLLAAGLLDLAYPRVCVHCGRPAPDLLLPLCPACLRHASSVDDTDLCRLAARTVSAATVMVLWRFEQGGPVQSLHHALKYGNRPTYGSTLGKLIGAKYDGPPPDAVLPVPLHAARRYERGYNQAEMLARGIGETLGCPVDNNLLARVRSTKTQTHLSADERQRNVAGAFAVAGADRVKNRHFLLVDDILTTGATLNAARASLLASGARQVDLAVLAVAE